MSHRFLNGIERSIKYATGRCGVYWNAFCIVDTMVDVLLSHIDVATYQAVAVFKTEKRLAVPLAGGML